MSPQSGTHAGTHLGLAGLTSHDHGTGYQLSTNALTGKLLQGPGNTREQREKCTGASAPSATTRRTRSARSARSSTPTHRLAHPTCPHPPPLPAARQWHCASSVHTRAYNTRALSSDAAHGRRTASRTHPTRANAAGLMRTTRGTPRRCARRTPSATDLAVSVCSTPSCP